MANSLAGGQGILDTARSKGLRVWGAPAMVVIPQFAFMVKTLRRGGSSVGWRRLMLPTDTGALTGRRSFARRAAAACPT